MMNRQLSIHVLAMLILFVTTQRPLYGSLLTVDISGTGDFQSIQAAINTASSGDTILVRQGTYLENLDFLGKAISLQSSSGPSLTTIEGNGGTVVTIGGQGAEIGGFTITGGNASFGAGLEVSGKGTLIRGNIFEGNAQLSGGFGAAIGGNSASPIIEQNIFRNNTSDNQWLSGVVSFVNSSSPLIVNNIFTDNDSRAINLTLPSSNNPCIINNTFVNNRVGIRVDRRVDSSNYIFRNNILVGNGIGLEVDFGGETYNPIWENNLVFGNTIDYDIISNQTGLAGNISANPLFVDPLSDFRLYAGSPAIDAGSPTGAPLYDFFNQIRPFDGNGDGIAKFDIGAIEYIPEPASLLLLGLGGLMLRRKIKS